MKKGFMLVQNYCDIRYVYTSDVPTTVVLVLLIVGKSVVVCQRWGCFILGHENPSVCSKIIRG